MDAAGGAPVQLSEQLTVGPPCVSPDGKHVLFLATRKDRAQVYLTVSTAIGKVESEYPVPSTVSWWGMSWMPDNRSGCGTGFAITSDEFVGLAGAGKRPGKADHTLRGWVGRLPAQFPGWEMDGTGAGTKHQQCCAISRSKPVEPIHTAQMPMPHAKAA
jgi:hypothetical protein